ncbi:MAG: hypothetical protein K2H60_14135 [Muribaculaceae bacterium]|nr:hypothetical protein [Muribaculaceae bacterium]
MKETPIEKVPEAWTAIADNRVKLAEGYSLASGSAVVASSDGDKSYMVTWRDGGQIFTSTDPATYWQGYSGYPVIAVLMLLGRLSYNKELAAKFAGVEWKKVNTKFRNDYSKALKYVEEERSIDAEAVTSASTEVLNELKSLALTIKRK